MKKNKFKNTIYAINKKATFDFKILEKYEAGITLTGPEVKSTRSGGMNLKGSYVKITSKLEIFLINAHISKYKPAFSAQIDYDPNRSRKLLMHKKEIAKLHSKVKEKQFTIVPIRVYDSRGFIKIEIGLARGKKKYEKREDLKKKDIERKIRKVVKFQEY